MGGEQVIGDEADNERKDCDYDGTMNWGDCNSPSRDDAEVDDQQDDRDSVVRL